MSEPAQLCPDDELLRLTEAAERDTRQGLRRVEALLSTYAGDPRLHFLRGSLLAALERYAEAAGPMQAAIDLAPDFHIARFQLGLLHLSSGSAEQAADCWAPLSNLPATDSLRLFAEGLQDMAQDRFASADRRLTEGLARNQHHPALDRDMQMVLEQIRNRPPPEQPAESESSPAHWLLHVAAKTTKH